VTCPSPAMTTFPSRRTHKMVVERIFTFLGTNLQFGTLASDVRF
jgi:hypothetical protein